MKTDIQKYLAECDTCQQQKFETIAPSSLLQPLHTLYKKNSKIYMDFITSLPTSEGKDSIFVIVDRLTKYSHFIGVSSKDKASQVVYSYVKNIFKLHRFPKVIVNNRYPKFTSNFWKLFWQAETSSTKITFYHPQTDG